MMSLLIFVVIPKLQVVNATKIYEQGGANGKENLLTVIDQAASKSKKWELIRKYLIGDGPISAVYGFDVYVGPSSTMSQSANGESRNWTWEEKLPYLEAYIAEGPSDGGYLVRAARQLSYYYTSEGMLNKALTALELAEQRMSKQYSNIGQDLKLDRAKLYMDNDEMDKAEQLLDEMANGARSINVDLNGEVAQLRAQIRIRKGDVGSALERVNKELEELKKTIADHNKQFPDKGDFTPVKLEQLTALKESLEHNLQQYGGSTATVSGTIARSDGTPMKRVGVYLRDRKAVSHSVTDGEPYQTLTDAKGHYKFEGVLPESYQLYIGIQFEQIDGWTWPTTNDDWIDVSRGQSLTENIVLHPLIEIKSPINQQVIAGDTITFRWEPVEGAAYYNLQGSLPIQNGTIGTMIKGNIRDDYIEIPVEQLYDQATGISYKFVEDKEIIDTSTLLGFANPASRFAWSVEAFDEQGRPLSRSNGYRLNENTIGDLPFFYLKNRLLTEADQLLLDDKIDEALIAYKQSYANDHQDLHSLRMIIRIYEAAASANSQRTLGEEVVPYIIQMADVNPTSEYIFKLVDYYIQKQDWMLANRYYALLSKQGDSQISPYVKSIYATALMKQKRLKEAGELFAQALAEDRSHRFVGPYLAISIYEQGAFEDAKKLASEYPERSFAELNQPVWFDLIQGIEKEEEKEKEKEKASGSGYTKELHIALEVYFGGDEARLNRWISASNYTAMKAFIEALRKVD